MGLMSGILARGATVFPKIQPVRKISYKKHCHGGNFHPPIQKNGWTEQSKVVSEFIFKWKCNFFRQTDALPEKISDYFSICAI